LISVGDIEPPPGSSWAFAARDPPPKRSLSRRWLAQRHLHVAPAGAGRRGVQHGRQYGLRSYRSPPVWLERSSL